MIDAKKLGKIFREKEEVTSDLISGLIEDERDKEQMHQIMKMLIKSGMVVQYFKKGDPYGLTTFGKHFMGID